MTPDNEIAVRPSQAPESESESEEERPVNVVVSDDYDPYFLKSIDGTVYR